MTVSSKNCHGVQNEPKQIGPDDVPMQDFKPESLAPWPWHKLLILGLTGRLDLQDLKDVDCFFEEDRASLSDTDPRPGADVLALNDSTEYDRIIESAVLECQWIEPSERDEFVREILLGNEDAAVSLLLILSPNVASVRPPLYGSHTAQVFRRIGQAYASDPENSDLPLRKLIILVTPAINGEYAWPLNWLQDLVGIPSLKRIFIDGPFDDKFEGWKPDTLRPTCPEIYIRDGYIPSSAIKAFAEGWSSPCVIEQQFLWPTLHGIDGPDEPDWTTCNVIGSEPSTPNKLELYSSASEPLRTEFVNRWNDGEYDYHGAWESDYDIENWKLLEEKH